MSLQPQENSPVKQWESVHRCPECGRITNLADIDLRVIATGIIECPKCDWSGAIKIEVVEIEAPKD